MKPTEEELDILAEAYFKPAAEYLKAKFEREANEWNAKVADLANGQLSGK